jgi:hypothetical protein
VASSSIILGIARETHSGAGWPNDSHQSVELAVAPFCGCLPELRPNVELVQPAFPKLVLNVGAHHAGLFSGRRVSDCFLRARLNNRVRPSCRRSRTVSHQTWPRYSVATSAPLVSRMGFAITRPWSVHAYILSTQCRFLPPTLREKSWVPQNRSADFVVVGAKTSRTVASTVPQLGLGRRRSRVLGLI